MIEILNNQNKPAGLRVKLDLLKQLFHDYSNVPFNPDLSKRFEKEIEQKMTDYLRRPLNK